MAYIPNDAKWYLARIVMEITVQDDPRNIVHINTTLVRAGSPSQAYDQAQKLGVQSATNYENRRGKTVAIRFRGLKSLDVIHEELENGAELEYSEMVAVAEEEIAKLVKAKKQLEAFRPVRASRSPDYGSSEVS